MDKTERSYTDRVLNKQCRGFASVSTSEIGISLFCNDSANSKGVYNVLCLTWKYLSQVMNFFFKICELKVSDSCECLITIL